jgi:hypothetical protein
MVEGDADARSVGGRVVLRPDGGVLRNTRAATIAFYVRLLNYLNVSGRHGSLRPNIAGGSHAKHNRIWLFGFLDDAASGVRLG